jgi:hypothetical protein
MRNCTLLFLMCGFLLGSCESMALAGDVTVINDSDYEAVNIKLAYLYINNDKKKTKDIGALTPVSKKKVTLTFSDPVLMTCASLVVIEYYINGIKYGGDGFDADYPVGTLSNGGNIVFIIKNDKYDIYVQ